MPNRVDFSFIAELEGGCQLQGYVPAAGISSSGVTIATGFDLGQRTEADLRKLGLSNDLVAKLKPYLGKIKQEAVAALAKQPLRITPEEGLTIDKCVKQNHLERLQLKYGASPFNVKKVNFFDLPAECQTAIASVSFQYGVNLNLRAPVFWKAASSQNWHETVRILNNFGDAYPTRRGKEAKLLGKILK